MSAHQSYLEAPYVAASQAWDAYEAWCEDMGIDSSEDHWDEFEQWCDEAAEDHAMAAAESRYED